LLVTDLKDAELLTDGVQVGGWTIRNYRYDLLKLFFISLLWRASVSKMSFYRRIKLGQFESVAKRLLRTNDPGSPEDFAVILARFIDAPSGGVVLDPHQDRLNGVKYCRFYLGKYVAYIKADTRPSPGIWGQFTMKPGQPLSIMRRNLQQSTEWPLIRKIVAGVKGQGES